MKYLQAIVRYELAARAVSALTLRIGEALGSCPISIEAYRESAPFGEPKDTGALWDGNRIKTHLHAAYNEVESDGSGYGSRRLQGGEIGDWLADSECEHCLLAWQLIEERKEARRAFGIAKRAIRSIGRAEIKKASA